MLLTVCSSFSQDIDWAQQDLHFMHDAIRDNHPGMYNMFDPSFEQFLTLQHRSTLNKLKHCTDDSEKIALLRSFVTSFDDAHLRIEGKAFGQNVTTANNTDIPTQRGAFAVTELNKNICWISLPTFQPNIEEQALLQNITQTLAQRQQSFTPDDCIVFDIRGNGGGNSMFAGNIVKALFGQEYMSYSLEKLYSKVSVDWRASKGNIAYLQQIKQKNIENPQQTAFIDWLTQIIEGMQQAVNNEKPYFTQQNKQPDVLQEKPSNPLKARVVVIVDKHCFSATLDFIDYLKAMEHNIVLIGETTGADSFYMDVNELPLPSGKGKLIVPMKVYRNRVREHNEPYVPDITYQGDINDTVALQQFVTKQLSPHLDKLISIMENRRKRFSWSEQEFVKMFEDHIRVSMHITYGDQCQDGDPLVEKVITRALDLNEATNRGLPETIIFALKLFKCAGNIDQVDNYYYLCRTLIGMCRQSMQQALEYMQQYDQTPFTHIIINTTNTHLITKIKAMLNDYDQDLIDSIVSKAIWLHAIGNVSNEDILRLITVLAHGGTDLDEEYITYQYHLYYAATHYLKKSTSDALELVLRCAMSTMTEKDYKLLLSRLHCKKPWWEIACPQIKNLFPEMSE